MDGQLLWVLLSVSTIASLAGAGFAAWAVLAWRRTPAGKATEAIEAGIRVVTFRLAQMDGHLGAMDATLQAEAAKTIAIAGAGATPRPQRRPRRAAGLGPKGCGAAG